MKFTPKNIAIGVVVLAVVALVLVQTMTDYDLLKFLQKDQGNEPNVPSEQQNPDEQNPQAAQLVDGEDCIGTPINVAYSYPHPVENFDNPWECEVQCADKVQRYISYSNGTATPCEKLPGCLDLGEDQAVTCVPPAAEDAE